jgi:acetyl esterase/lipase
MSASQAAELDRLLREGPLDLGGDLAVQRPLLEELMSSHPLPCTVTAAAITLGGVPAVEVRTVGAGDPRDVLFYLHGGAYAMGSARAGAGLAAQLASRAGVRAVSVDYRLAPEAPFPAAFDDARAAYDGLLRTGVAPERIVVAGESAGGGLALALLAAVAAHGHPRPAAAVVMSPWADLTLSGPTVAGAAHLDPVLTAVGLATRAAEYAGAHELSDPRISPLFAELRGLPALLIQAGSHEILLADALRLAERAAVADVEVSLQIFPGMPHVFQGFADSLVEGRAALDAAATFVSHHLSQNRIR